MMCRRERERIHIFLCLWLFSLSFEWWYFLDSSHVLLMVGASWFRPSVIVAAMLTEGIARICLCSFVLCTTAIVPCVFWYFPSCKPLKVY